MTKQITVAHHHQEILCFAKLVAVAQPVLIKYTKLIQRAIAFSKPPKSKTTIFRRYSTLHKTKVRARSQLRTQSVWRNRLRLFAQIYQSLDGHGTMRDDREKCSSYGSETLPLSPSSRPDRLGHAAQVLRNILLLRSRLTGSKRQTVRRTVLGDWHLSALSGPQSNINSQPSKGRTSKCSMNASYPIFFNTERLGYLPTNSAAAGISTGSDESARRR